MTDTGQVPGEVLPENAGMVEQPAVLAPGAYAYLEPSEAAVVEDEDVLLMPSGQGGWGDPLPVPSPEPMPVAAPAPDPYASPEQQVPPIERPAPLTQPGDAHGAAGRQAPVPGVSPEMYQAPGDHQEYQAYVTPEQVAGTPVDAGPFAAGPYAPPQQPATAQATADPFAQDPVAAEAVGQEPHVPEPHVPEPHVQEAHVQEAPAQGPVAHEPFAPEPVAQEPSAQEPAAEQPSAPDSFGQGRPLHQPEAHETDGRDSGSVDLTGVRIPPPVRTTPAPAPVAATPPPMRRPLHLGPQVPDTSGGVVRSLADRGPAETPAHAVRVRNRALATPTLGPEYLDIPREETVPPLPGPQLGELPPQTGTPWTEEPTAPAETVVHDPEPVTPPQEPVAAQESVVDAQHLPGAGPEQEPAPAPEPSPSEQSVPVAPAEPVAVEVPAVPELRQEPLEAPVPVAEADPAPSPAADAEPVHVLAAEAEPVHVPAAAEPAAPAQVVPAAEADAAPAEVTPADVAPVDVAPVAEPDQEPGPAPEPIPELIPELIPEPRSESAAPRTPEADGIVAPEPGPAAAPVPVLPSEPAPAVAPEAEVTAQAGSEDAPLPAPEAAPEVPTTDEPPHALADGSLIEAPVQDGNPDQDVSAPPRTEAAASGYDDVERDTVLRVMRERRDIRNGFRSDPIPHEVLLRVLEAAHTAPSVGHSQPWDFVVIRSAETRRAMHELAQRQREAYAKSLPKGRAKQFKELKIEAILETPVNIVVTADPTRGGRHTLGRHTQPQMAPYSSALAVENLWLAGRAEGLGVGWVSFFDEREMVRALGLPEHLEVVAYLVVGYVDEFPEEPELMQSGWSKRRPLSWVVHEETYGRRALPGEEPQDLLQETVSAIRPLDAKALGEAWERQKRMTKPAGALGMLEIISAQLSGLSRQCPPPIPEPAAVAIFAGDHGVHAQGVTPWPQEVTAQMVANFLGGGAVCNAFANQVGAEVCVIDVGVAGELPTTPGLLPRKVRAGTADFTTGPALTREEVLAAIEVGIETARDLVAAGNKALLTGEMGIANTTVSAALICVYTGQDPSEVTGRGTGINDETHARKIDVVRRGLDLHRPDPADPVGVLAAVGGLEHAALVGFLLGGASLRTPVILDGVSAGAAALVARAIAPEALAACIAGHRSAEPGHMAALNKLGLRPLIDLDLRLGEGTGALLALPVIQSAARAMHEVATFDSAGVTEK